MIRQKIILALRFYRILDLLVVSLAFRLSVFLTASHSHLPRQIDQINDNWRLSLMIIPLWGILLHFGKLYSSQRGKNITALLWNIIKANLAGLVCLNLLLYIVKLNHINVYLILTFIITSTVLLIVEKLVVLACLSYSRKKGKNVRFVLIVGTGERAKRFIRTINQHPEAGFRIIGCLGSDPHRIGRTIAGIDIIGTSDNLNDIIHKQPIDEIIFALPLSKKYLLKIRDYLIICNELGINGRIITDFHNFQDIFKKNVFIDELLGVPLVSFSALSRNAVDHYLKFAFDFIFSLLAIIILAPVMLIVAISVKLSSPGPVIFKQKRSGLQGRTFTLYKFRTMVVNAEAMQEDMKALNEMSGPVFKVTNDKRVFPLGNYLRKTSFDEAPQLFNVIFGDMSLVGPRPLPTYEADKIRGPARRRLSIKPGITCTWQVSGRNDIDFNDWMKLDLEYIDNWSFLIDIKTLIKTIPAVFLRKGAR